MTMDGHTYEHQAIAHWFETGRNTSPLTNLRLPSRRVVANSALKGAIEEFLRLKPEVEVRGMERADFELAVNMWAELKDSEVAGLRVEIQKLRLASATRAPPVMSLDAANASANALVAKQ